MIYQKLLNAYGPSWIEKMHWSSRVKLIACCEPTFTKCDYSCQTYFVLVPSAVWLSASVSSGISSIWLTVPTKFCRIYALDSNTRKHEKLLLHDTDTLTSIQNRRVCTHNKLATLTKFSKVIPSFLITFHPPYSSCHMLGRPVFAFIRLKLTQTMITNRRGSCGD